MSAHLRRDWQGIHGAVRIPNALERLFSHIEDRLDAAKRERGQLDDDVTPLATGVPVLDEVLYGGVPRASVAVIESSGMSVANALLCSVARCTPHPRLFESVDIVETAAWLLAGSVGVPAAQIFNCILSEEDWARIPTGVERLCQQKLYLSSAGSLDALAAEVAATGVDLLLVHDASRFGTPYAFLPQLQMIADELRVAVVATTNPMGELPGSTTNLCDRVHIWSSARGDTASLLFADDELTVTAVQARVDQLCGDVR